MSEPAASFDVSVEHVDGYEFRVRFDKPEHEVLSLDEPAPLGRDSAPNATRVLAAAVGNCLAASLVFCSSRKGVKLNQVSATVHVELVRNENRRLRIGHMDVTLRPKLAEGTAADLDVCLDSFEDFCVVTQSVRSGLDVRVKVEPA